MKPENLLQILHVAEKLKCSGRHSFTSSGRTESVAEHSWRIALMAMLLENEFPSADINKVIKMCLIHDMGEAFTGDIPCFNKTSADEKKEDELLSKWISSFEEPERTEWQKLFEEMKQQQTLESKIYKALDKLEAVIQHDEADIKTWIPLEYDLQFSHGAKNVEFSEYLKNLKNCIDKETEEKIKNKK